MKEKVLETIKKFNMIPPGKKVIVALSGGSDSMSLLCVLMELKNELGFTLEAAHVNHQLRGEDADRDESFVRDFCEKSGVPIHILRADVKGESEKTGEGLEEAGRRIRYAYFASFGEDCLIATAHNLSDRIETFLFNFTRGAGLHGLCSIPPVRGNIIRPIIECSKADVLKYCESNGISYCTDKTNEENIYTRNKLRHNVVPVLSSINENFTTSAGRCIESLNEDEMFLKSLSIELIEKCKSDKGYGIKALYDSPAPIKNRAISQIIETETGIPADYQTIKSVSNLINDYIKNGSGKAIDIPSGKARTGAGYLKFPKNENEIPNEIILNNGANSFGKYIIILESNLKTKPIIDCKSQNEYAYIVDEDKICGKITASSRKAEDKITIPGRNITKSLRKLQNEKGIPPEERDILPVLRDESGIILATGCGIDKRVSVDSTTKNLIRIIIKSRV